MVDIEMVGGLVEQQDLMLVSSGPDEVACLPLPGPPSDTHALHNPDIRSVMTGCLERLDRLVSFHFTDDLVWIQ